VASELNSAEPAAASVATHTRAHAHTNTHTHTHTHDTVLSIVSSPAKVQYN
jgi:hypothetical protein